MTKAQADRSRITYTITGDFDLADVGAEQAILSMSEAMEKLREQGSAVCKAHFPEHDRDIEP